MTDSPSAESGPAGGGILAPPPVHWRRLWEAWRALFGYDLFVSYRWSDGSAYALDLVRQLERRGLSVFLDRHETPGGVRVRADIRRNLLRARGLLVVASPEAVRHHGEITPEIDVFAASHPRRPLHGIQFGDELAALADDHPWHPHFHRGEDGDSILWRTEPGGREALSQGVADSETVAFFLKSRWLLRRRKIAVALACLAAVLIVGATVSAGVSIAQRLVEGQRNLASSRGFEALDRTDETMNEGLAVAIDSLSIADTFAGRRAALSFWAQTPRITAVNRLYLRSPLALRDHAGGGYDLIGSSGLAIRIEEDLSVATRALEFDTQRLSPGVSNWLTAADSGGPTGLLIGDRLGKIHEFDQETGAVSCMADRDGDEISALDAVPSAAGETTGWHAIGADCRRCSLEGRRDRRLLLWHRDHRAEMSVPLDHPEIVTAVHRLPGTNCLMVAGKTWEDEGTSLSLLSIEATPQGARVANRAQFDATDRGHIERREISIEPEAGDKGYRAVAMIEGARDWTCGQQYCGSLAIYALETGREMARITRPSSNIVQFLPKQDGETDRWLVLGSWDGTATLHRLEDVLARRDDAVTLLRSDADVRNRAAFTWLNREAIGLIRRRENGRILLITVDGALFEIEMPDGSPRFGRRLGGAAPVEPCAGFGPASIRQTTPERRAAICEGLAGTEVTAIIADQAFAWIFHGNRTAELRDATGTVIASGQTPPTDRVGIARIGVEEQVALSRVYDGVRDPDAEGAWAMRSDGTLLHLSLRDGAIRAVPVSYSNSPSAVVQDGRLISFSVSQHRESSLRVQSLAEGRLHFDDGTGPTALLQLFGYPLQALPLPGTSHVFLAVRWRGDLAVEIVDLERRRSLAPPVRLGPIEDWGSVTQSVSLADDPHPDLSRARLSFDPASERVILWTPVGKGFRIDWSLEAWRQDLEAVFRWRPEAGAAEALGLAPGAYPERKARAVEAHLVEECPTPATVLTLPPALARMLPGAGEAIRAPASAAGPDAFAALSRLFPLDLPGCSMLQSR